MKWRVLILLALWLVAVMTPAVANEPVNAQVTGVQPPAWVERAELRTPLHPGVEVTEDVVIVTGEGARVQLQMSDGARLQLGGDGRFALDQLARAQSDTEEKSTFMRLLRGVFRYTRGVVEGPEDHAISIEVGVYVVGIRGTDIWGRSTAGEGDLFALIEGEAEVRIEGVTEPLYPDPMTFLEREPGSEPAPFTRPIDPDTLAEWAAQTDLQPHEGVMEPEGVWQAVLVSLRNESAAANMAGELREAGYPARVQDVQVNDQTSHRVSLDGFASREDAVTVGERLSGRFGVGEEVWIRMSE